MSVELQVIRTGAAAKLLGISPDTLRAWVRRGWVRAVDCGSEMRFRRADLFRAVEERPVIVAADSSVDAVRADMAEFFGGQGHHVDLSGGITPRGGDLFLDDFRQKDAAVTEEVFG